MTTEPYLKYSRKPVVEPEVQVIEPAKAEIDPDDVEEILKAKLPLINNPRKASYLMWRASGFSVRESAALTDVRQRTVVQWRKEDPEFALWETKSLSFLQRGMADDISRAEFMRNFRLAMMRDQKVLYKSVYNFEGLSDREYDYLKTIRKHYTPGDMLALERALAPDPTAGQSGSVSVTVNIGDEAVETEHARRAGARELLERFKANDKYLNPDQQLIEGEVVSTS